MKSLSIDMTLFELAFTHDAAVHDPFPINSYLDLLTGDVFFVYENDAKAASEGIPYLENRLKREKVARGQDRYLLIPGRPQGDQHDFLKAFLISPWSADKAETQAAQRAYCGSVGRWMAAVRNQNAVDKYFAFRDERLSEYACDFLREHGIEPKRRSSAAPPLQLELALFDWNRIWIG
jgi:hypothetical protein